MTKEVFAKLLNGRQYRDEMSKEEEAIAKESNLIVIFGQSDDLIEFRGALNDEIDAYDGTDFIIATPGQELGTGEYWNDMPTYVKAVEMMPVAINSEDPRSNIPERISAMWCPKDQDVECSWYIKTDLQHFPFNIMEDGEIYCRGIVISVVDLIVNQ